MCLREYIYATSISVYVDIVVDILEHFERTDQCDGHAAVNFYYLFVIICAELAWVHAAALPISSSLFLTQSSTAVTEGYGESVQSQAQEISDIPKAVNTFAIIRIKRIHVFYQEDHLTVY